jgi:hypothetical protein
MVKWPAQGKAENLIRNLHSGAGVIMMLFFYLAAFVYSPVGVPHIHHEEDFHQGDSCEKDACHIAIFHPGSEGRCEHKFHFTQSKEECDLCNIVLPRQLVESIPVYREYKIEFSDSSFCAIQEKALTPFLLHTDRGPPALI